MQRLSQLFFSLCKPDRRHAFIKREIRSGWSLKAGLVSLLFLCQACAQYSATGGPKPLIKSPLTTEVGARFEPARMNAIAILPIQPSPEVSESMMATMTGMLLDAFQLKSNVEIVNLKNPTLFESTLNKLSSKNLTLSEQAKEFGAQTGVHGVLVPTISHFRESSGGRLGADEGASVGFKLKLFDTRSGEVVWSAIYENANAPLSDNLFTAPRKLAGGIQYKSADKLIGDGFLKAASNLEKLRSEAIF